MRRASAQRAHREVQRKPKNMPDTTAPLTRAELDRLTCHTPGCTHEKHDGLFLHSRCHTKSPAIVRAWGDGVVEIRCKVCNGFIGSIQSDQFTTTQIAAQVVCNDPSCQELISDHSVVMKPPCHPKAGAFAVYQDGHLHVVCAMCKKQIIGFHVATGAASS